MTGLMQPPTAAPRRPASAAPRRRPWLAWTAAVVAVGLAAGGVLWGLDQRRDPGPAADGSQRVIDDSDSGEQSAALEPDAGAVGRLVAEANFATPEDALTWNITEFLAGRPLGAARSCASTSKVEHFDYAAYLERAGMASGHDPYSVGAPTGYPVYDGLTELAGLSACTRSSLAYYTLYGSDVAQSITVPIADEAAAQEFVASITPTTFSDVTIDSVDVIGVVEVGDTGSTLRENYSRLAEINGGDAYGEVAALVTVDGSSYAMGANAVRYGTRWLLVSRGAYLMGMSSTGVDPMSAAEYAQAVSSAQARF